MNIVTELQYELQNNFNSEQILMISNTLQKILYNYDITEKSTEVVVYSDESYRILNKFIAVRRLAGLSERTLKQYHYENNKMLEFFGGKNVCEITTDDLRFYLLERGKTCCKRSINNIIRYLNAFFDWLDKEEIIVENPMRKIDSVKEEQKIKKPFTDEELEILHENAKCTRDVAIIETLLATGVRVSELSNLNIQDINFANMSAIVYGKGKKERRVYFTKKSLYYLSKYLKTRTDESEALFVSNDKNARRLSTKAIEALLRRLGNESGILCHPHKFRRTLATRLLQRGMSLEYVSKIMGHVKLDTTLIYTFIEDGNVQTYYQKVA